jgi:hypothetical protein
VGFWRLLSEQALDCRAAGEFTTIGVMNLAGFVNPPSRGGDSVDRAGASCDGQRAPHASP